MYSFPIFNCNPLHNHLQITEETVRTWTDTRYPPSVAIIVEAVSVSQITFSLQGNRWGSFPFRLNSAMRWDAAVYLSSQQKDKYTSSCLLNLLRSLFSLNSCSTSDNDSRGIFSSRLLSISMPIHLAQVEGEEAIMSVQKNLLFTVKSNS